MERGRTFQSTVHIGRQGIRRVEIHFEQMSQLKYKKHDYLCISVSR